MNHQNRLADLFPQGEILHREDHPGKLFSVRRNRAPFGSEILIIRFLEPESDYDTYQSADLQLLEGIFYDEDTPNPWNIQLFWVYNDNSKPPKDIRRDLERETRFAIRRVVPEDKIDDFIAPLEKAQNKLDNISEQFNRGKLIQDIFDEGLGFLFDETKKDEKFERLKNGDYDEGVPDQDKSFDRDPIQEFISEVNMGEFREDQVVFDRMDTNTFTLLYGPNASGKTSILDAVTLGLVGQIRHPKVRVSDYEDVNVTLDGYSESLDTDSDLLSDRVADWFGYRPHTSKSRCEEFYRVNYLEAGEATRIVDQDLNIQQTFRRFLHGEELTDAIDNKREIIQRLEDTIGDKEVDIEDLQQELTEKKEKRKRVEDIFSELRAAAKSLSPATVELVTQDGEQGRDLQPTKLEGWSKWAQRFEMIEESLNALPEENTSPESPKEIYDQLSTAIEQVEGDIDAVKQYHDQESRLRQLIELRQFWTSEEMQYTPASVGLILIILSHYGLTTGDLTTIKEALHQATDPDDLHGEIGSVKSWQQSVIRRLKSHLQDLQDRKSQIEELSDIKVRRKELRDEIRSNTEDYLSIVEDVNYCPACYIKQDREAILNRDEPSKKLTDGTQGQTNSIEKRIQTVKKGLETMERIDWESLSNTMRDQFREKFDFEDFQELWRNYNETENLPRIPAVKSLETAEALANEMSETLKSPSDRPWLATVLQEAIESANEQMEEIDSELSSIEHSKKEDQMNLNRLERRKKEMEAAVDIFNEYWPDDIWTDSIDIKSDLHILEATLRRFEDEPASLELTTDIEQEIEYLTQKLDETSKEIDTCIESIERLRRAFNLADNGEALDSLVQDHMSVISTLFTAFQRPYEFRQVSYQDEEIIVERQDTGEFVGPEALSAGQRAALALAIFVTNNLAHESAPPLMLLDEPFAHLDDVNTVAFFNLLIELATRRERQIIFATANRDIADLIERKAGDADEFEREDIPRTKAGIDIA